MKPLKVNQSQRNDMGLLLLSQQQGPFHRCGVGRCPSCQPSQALVLTLGCWVCDAVDTWGPGTGLCCSQMRSICARSLSLVALIFREGQHFPVH